MAGLVMERAFRPINDLEECLLQAKGDKGQLGVFIMKLFSSKVAILTHETDPDRIRPLMITGASGVPVVAIFTSPERATPWVERYGEFDHALITDTTWVLKGLGPGVGAAINPGWSVGFEIEPDGLRKLMRDFGCEGQRQEPK